METKETAVQKIKYKITLRASQLGAALRCPGIVTLQQDLTSPYAEAGTRLHKQIEEQIKNFQSNKMMKIDGNPEIRYALESVEALGMLSNVETEKEYKKEMVVSVSGTDDLCMVTLIGHVDAIVTDVLGRINIVDFKTGEWAFYLPVEEDLQMLCYLFLVLDLEKDYKIASVSRVHVSTEQTHYLCVDRETDVYMELRKKIHRVVGSIVDDLHILGRRTFIAGEHCTSCFSRSNCNEYFTLMKPLSDYASNKIITSENAKDYWVAASVIEDICERVKTKIREMLISGEKINGLAYFQSEKDTIVNHDGLINILASEIGELSEVCSVSKKSIIDKCKKIGKPDLARKIFDESIRCGFITKKIQGRVVKI